MRKKRALLASCIVILLCVLIITGMSYALFTDSARVTNHLKAGNLKVSLVRTNLEYKVLDDKGEMPLTTNTEKVDFTNSVDESIFGIDSSSMLIAPTSYFEATLEISNNGEVAFTYSVQLVLSSGANDLAEQLRVTITDAEGNQTTCMLNELNADKILTGRLTKGASSESFKVRIEFVDDVKENEGVTDADELLCNNDAMDQVINFDLVVSAVQDTEPQA